MADPLQERTQRLLADYLEHCAREPGSCGRRPCSPEAARLRSVAAQVRERHPRFFSALQGYPGDRVRLVERMADAVLADGLGLSWGRVVTLLTFAGALLETGRRVQVDRDRRRLQALLCTWLAVRHRAWLEAQGGWDGFCLFFRTPLPLTFWRRLLIQTVLTCFFTMTLIYFWMRFYRKFSKF